MNSEKQYLPENHEHDITGRISDLYGIHVNAMTREGLHSKSHIAWELARRDLANEELREALREIVEAKQVCLERRSLDSDGNLMDAIKAAASLLEKQS